MKPVRLSSLLGQGERPPQKQRGVPYGRVFFALRKHFGLTVSECLLADVVDTLSRRTGWCFASREYLADLLGVSLRSTKRFLASLRAKGLIERKPGSLRQLRPTERWKRAKVALVPGQDDTHII